MSTFAGGSSSRRESRRLYGRLALGSRLLLKPEALGESESDGWALNEEAVRNLGYMQLKKTHDAAMVLIERLYGRKPEYNSFVGTSQGGREALTVAQRRRRSRLPYKRRQAGRTPENDPGSACWRELYPAEPAESSRVATQRARDGSPRTGCRGPFQQADRLPSAYCRCDSQESCEEYLREAERA